jgi:hypothetical protein
MRHLLTVAGLLLPVLALAQSSPQFKPGQVPSPPQWNAYFSGKADVTGGTLNAPTINGGTLNGLNIVVAQGTPVYLDATRTMWVMEDSGGNVLIGTGTSHLFRVDPTGNLTAAGTITFNAAGSF